MTTDLDTSSTVNATQRARAASSAAVANAASAAHSAALAAQNAASLAQTAAQNAAVIAANAARSASGAAQTAASGTTKGVREVKHGVFTARSWTAPRLDNAADYFTAIIAPRVSSALRATARRVSPTETSSKRSSILVWSVLGAAALAAAGAGAAVVRYRFRAAIAADSEEAAEGEVPGDSTGSQPAPVTPDGTRSAAAAPADPKAETPAKGPVSSSGR